MPHTHRSFDDPQESSCLGHHALAKLAEMEAVVTGGALQLPMQPLLKSLRDRIRFDSDVRHESGSSKPEKQFE